MPDPRPGNQDRLPLFNHVSAAIYRKLLWELMQCPQDLWQLAEKTGLSRNTVARWLAPWRKRTKDIPKMIFIAEWHRDGLGRQQRPAFFFSPDEVNVPDAKRTPAKTNTERQRACRRRKALRKQLHQFAGNGKAPDHEQEAE